MKKIITIKDADGELVVSFPCRLRCDNCPWRFDCYTTLEDVDLLIIDIDIKLQKLPRTMYDDFWGIPDDEFYHKAFKLVTNGQSNEI